MSNTPRGRAHYLTHKIINFLHENGGEYRIEFKRLHGNEKLRDHYGLRDVNTIGAFLKDEQLIIIDPRFNVLEILIHEVIHVLYPKMRENDVRRNEHAVMRHLTDGLIKQIWFAAGLMMVHEPEESGTETEEEG